MKKLFVILFLFIAATGQAQSKKEKAVIERTYLLSHTVFGSKDSLVLEDLFAKNATYGHSGGKIESRYEAIKGIVQNKSLYSDTAVSGITVIFEEDAAIVRYLFRAKETKQDQSVSALNFSMMLVWVKKKGKWKLMGRQAVRLAA